MSKQFNIKLIGKYSFDVKKTVLFQIIQLRISMQFKYESDLIVKNISISNYSV